MAPRKYFIHFSESPDGRTLHLHVPWAHYYRDDMGDRDTIMRSRRNFSEQMDRNERRLFLGRLESGILDALINVKTRGAGVVIPRNVLLDSLPGEFHHDYRLRKTVISVPLSRFFDSVSLEHLKDALLPKLPPNAVLLARSRLNGSIPSAK